MGNPKILGAVNSIVYNQRRPTLLRITQILKLLKQQCRGINDGTRVFNAYYAKTQLLISFSGFCSTGIQGSELNVGQKDSCGLKQCH